MKSILKKSILMLTAPCLMIACGSNGGSDNKDKGGQPTVTQAGVPDSLDFQKPTSGNGLTKAEVQKIKAALAIRPQMILPPGELIFPNPSMSAGEIAQKEEALKRQDQNSYNLLMDIRQTCKRPHPTVEMNATFPTDNPVTVDSIEGGDKVGFNAMANLLGDNCITELAGNSGGNAKVDQVDHATNSASLGAGISSGVKAIMKNPKYSKLLGMRGIIMNSNLSGLTTIRELGKATTTGKGLLKFNLSGSLLSLTADIPYKLSFKGLFKGNQDKSNSVEMVVETQIQVPEATANIQVHTLTNTAADGTQTSLGEIYVNGKQMTEQELKDLIGDTSQVAIGHSTVVNGLMLK